MSAAAVRAPIRPLRFTRLDLPRSGIAAQASVEHDGSLSAIFLHGLACGPGLWPLRAWRHTAAHLIAFHLPGHGASRTALACDLPAIAAQLAAAIDELGCRQIVLVGHSLGGLVALHLEALLDARVRETVLLATGARFADVATSLGVLRDAESDWSRWLAGRIFAGGASLTTRRMAAANMARTGRRTVIAGLRALEHYDAAVDLPPLRRLPRTLVFGSDDALVTGAEALRLARLVDAVPVPLAGVGHFPMLEAPAVIVDLCRSVLERHGDGQALAAGAP